MFEVINLEIGVTKRKYFRCPECGEKNAFFADSFGCEFCEARTPPSATHLILSNAARLRWHLIGKLEPKVDNRALCETCIWRDAITNLRDESTAVCDGCYSFSGYQEDYST